MTVMGIIQQLIKEWQGAEGSVKVFTVILVFGGLIGWIAAIFECSSKRREIADFMNTNGWKIK